MPAPVVSVAARSAAFFAAHPQESVFQTAALQKDIELTEDMVRQEFASWSQLLNQGRAVRLDELVESRKPVAVSESACGSFKRYATSDVCGEPAEIHQGRSMCNCGS